MFECLLQPAELAGAADERRIEPSCEGRSLFVQREQALRKQGLALSLQLERDGLALDGVTEELCGLGPEQHLAGARGLLEPRRDVHGIACGKSLGRAHDDLAGVETDPRVDAELR